MKTLKNLLKIVPLPACARALGGFQTAANRWQNVLHDNLQVKLNIAFAALNPGVLGPTSSCQGSLSYAGLRQDLINDAKTSTDLKAIASCRQVRASAP